MAHFYFENTPHGVQRNGKKLHTQIHYAYICREGKYAQMRNREEDLVFSRSGNMPSWADEPADFWQQAELHRRKDGRAYREFRIALQEEFSLAENIELVERLLKDTGIKADHAYSYAIHDKTAAFDKEHKNIHCHLMFNECVIEKDRPLGPEKYFKRYSKDRAGNPTQGYRTTDYFEKKETTFALRKKWADLVNEKFAEKGMECRISEKSNDKQREDFQNEGKHEEAALLNRQRAPHMGATYRNPGIMERIHEKTKEIEKNLDQTEPFQPQENLSPLENKIRMFANDIVIRKMAREIQFERRRLQKEIEEQVAKQQAAEIMEEDPTIITIEHIYQYAAEKAAQQLLLANEKLAAYKKMRSEKRDDKQQILAAKEKLFNGQYEKNMKAYGKIVKELKATQELAAAAIGSEQLATYTKKMHDLVVVRNDLGKTINYYKAALAGEHREKFQQILEGIKQEEQQKPVEMKTLYREYSFAKKEAEKYTALAMQLSAEDREQVIFSDKVPPALSRKAKLDGEIPVASLPVTAHNGQVFPLLAEPAETAEKGTYKTMAVKINDPIRRGKVPIYTVFLKKNDAGKWAMVSAHKTDKEKRLYKARLKTNEAVSRQHPIVENANQQKQQQQLQKVSQIADILAAEDRSLGALRAHWAEEEQEKKDRVTLTEKQMYNGWNL